MTQDQPGAGRPIIVDARGLSCPLPVLRLRQRLRDVEAGAPIELLATDPAALRDVGAFCLAHGHVVQSIGEDTKGSFRFRIMKALPDDPSS